VTTPTFGPPVEVHLLGLPVPVASRAQQHVEELLREFALVASGREAGDTEHEVPGRLLQLIDALTQQFGGVNTEAEERLAAAIDAGDAVIEDHVMNLPPEAAPACVVLGDMLDEADDYCRRGKHLLTLATPDDCLHYRKWYLSDIVTQLEGGTPTSWPDYLAARS
jgi:ElaB/YqjD/DUF883 family membrane-anchored ribosome-binding protein